MTLLLSMLAFIVPGNALKQMPMPWIKPNRQHHRHHKPPPKMYTQLASWYYDGGGTACGFHARYGVANKRLPCGAKVLFRYHGRSVWATVQDRGPFVYGRVWDLNQNLATTLGFSGVDYIQASVYG